MRRCSIMRFGIHANKTRDIGYEVAQELASVMLNHGHVPVFREYMKDTAIGIDDQFRRGKMLFHDLNTMYIGFWRVWDSRC